MDKKLTILAVVVLMAGLLAFNAELALADTITVHCVNETTVNPLRCSCQDDHATIQAAVNHADPGETVCVGLGTYPEQVTITKPLTLEGEGAGLTTIRPSSVTANTTSLVTGTSIAAIVLVDGVTGGVEVSALTVDGEDAAPTSCSAYVGIYYRASSGTIGGPVIAEGTHVTNIFEPSAPGCQGVLGIFVQTDKPGKGKANVAILSNMVDQYGKNGITANQAGTFVTVGNNVVTGRGPTMPGDAAQNGVQIGFGARGMVSGNTISANYFADTPNNIIACGLLFFRAGGGIAQARDNMFAANEQDICNAGGGPSPHSPFNQ